MACKVNTHSKNNKYENSLNIKKNQNPFWTKIYNEYDNFRGLLPSQMFLLKFCLSMATAGWLAC